MRAGPTRQTPTFATMLCARVKGGLSSALGRTLAVTSLAAAACMALGAYTTNVLFGPTALRDALYTPHPSEQAYGDVAANLAKFRQILGRCMREGGVAQESWAEYLGQFGGSVSDFREYGAPVDRSLVESHAWASNSLSEFATELGRFAEAWTGTPEQCEAMLRQSSAAADHLLQYGSAMSAVVRKSQVEDALVLSTLQQRVVILIYVLCAVSAIALTACWRWYDSSQRERHAKEQGEEALTSRNRFLGMVSHELLSPVQVILSSMEILESRGGEIKKNPSFQRMRVAVRAMKSQVSDLVDFAKLSAGRLDIRPKPFVPYTLIDEVLQEYEGYLMQKDLEAEWDSHPSTEWRVIGDPRRIRQILANLYSNAIRYTEAGSITIEAFVDAKTKVLTMSVKDTGIGISAEDAEAIWRPYERVQGSRDMADGSGLGLAVVRSLVATMNGRIHLQSKPGEGSTFTVEIPVEIEALPAEDQAGVEAILIVDDLEGVREGLKGQLLAEHYVVDEAASVSEAKQRLATRRFATALIDRNLPDGDGVALAQWLRMSGGLNAKTRLVLLTANPPDDAESLQLFDEVLEKPIERAALLASLKQ